MMEQIIPETVSRHVKEKKIISSSQQGFSKGKPRLSNLLCFYNEITIPVDERGAADTAFLDF